MVARSCRFAAVSVLVVAWGLCTAVQADPDDPDRRTQQITSGVVSLLAKEHLSQRPLDDEISMRCLRTFLDRLDPWKLTFSQSDVDGFMRQQNNLDDQLRQGDARFAFAVFKTLVKRIKGQAGLRDELLAGEHDFSLDEQTVAEPDSARYARDESHCREKWRQRVKYDLLLLKAVGIEPSEALKRLTARYRRIADEVRRTDDEELLEMYLTSLAAAYDPHSAYLSEETMSQFRTTITLDREGIGAGLANENGYAVVRWIIRGGAADENGRLAVGDKILGVGQGASGEIEDVGGMKLIQVVALIRGKRGTAVRMEVVAADGRQGKTLTIMWRRIELKHKQVTGKIHQTGRKPDGKPCKIGVIDVPDFYMDMNGARQKQADYKCASRDVRNILEDFGKKEVDAVVLDVRHGSGSLTEPIKIVGLFIDRGPVVQAKSADGKVQSYGDEDPGTAWDGPLVVLTARSNSMCSEILAGALQDYRRGLVVGDGPTHGKGTVQSLMDLAAYVSPGQRPRPGLGAVKITLQQLYRPGGDSTQYRGVLPDVILPSSPAVFAVREADLDYAMPFDRVKSAEFERLEEVDDEVRRLLKESLARRRREATYLQEVLAITADYVLLDQSSALSENECRIARDWAMGRTRPPPR
ncbi:MAG: PDZ domain-containing protein [Planctomycetes bacterium]|nr:PDZ domain-containing protein [Planctomycetota bacterium]